MSGKDGMTNNNGNQSNMVLRIMDTGRVLIRSGLSLAFTKEEGKP